MVDAEAEVLALRGRITAAQRARVRAEHERDAAQAVANQARDRLASEFGVSTQDQARVLLAKLTADRDAALAELKAKLDAAGV